MNTIEQEAQELYPNEYTFENPFRKSFIRGAEFAQRWILCSDELPEIYSWVLCKSSVNDHYIGCSFGDRINIDTPNVIITHWRYIDIK